MKNKSNIPADAGNVLVIAALTLLATPAHAAGVCLVCPPGHTCAGGTAQPVAATGNARLATVGDIPTIGTAANQVAAGNHTHTAAQVGAVPTSRTVAGLALSRNISDMALAAKLSAVFFEVEERCAPERWIWNDSTPIDNTIRPTGTGTGRNCWCKLRGFGKGEYNGYDSLFANINRAPYASDEACGNDCWNQCHNTHRWRAWAVFPGG